jgi:hypothetical protein
MLEHILQCIIDGLERRLDLVKLTGPVIVQDRGSWLRIAPGESPRWYPTFEAANA